MWSTPSALFLPVRRTGREGEGSVTADYVSAPRADY
jgi:hypothetical protein